MIDIDREASAAEPEFYPGDFPAGKAAEQPAIVSVPIVLRGTDCLFRELLQQHGPSWPQGGGLEAGKPFTRDAQDDRISLLIDFLFGAAEGRCLPSAFSACYQLNT
jgi:hypothetical protein